jgi:hypothetical protein
VLSCLASQFLRTALFRNVALIACRMHEKPCWEGDTGSTASIPALLELAQLEGRLSPEQLEGFHSSVRDLKEKLANEGVRYKELKNFRHAELAHSIHRGQPDRLFFRPVWDFAHDTFELAIEIEKALGDATKLDVEFDAWRERGRDFWKSRVQA